MNADVLATTASPAPRPQAAPTNWLAIGALALLVLVTSWFSISYTRFQSGVSAVWLSNGLLTGALLLAPRRDWLRYFVAAAAAQLAARALKHDPWHYSVLLVAANMLECAVVAFWVRRREGELDRARSLPRVSRAAL